MALCGFPDVATAAGLAGVSGLLRCPVRGHDPAAGLVLDPDRRCLRCPDGHSFDLARRGYVNLLGTASGRNADSAEMLSARERVLRSGVMDGVHRGLAEACSVLPEQARLIDAGAGTGQHLARLLSAHAGWRGLAMDVSPAAARRAAAAHLRMGAVVADTWQPWPVLDGLADAVLAVFAPRNGAEFARVLSPDGVLVVITPRPDHLLQLRAGTAMLGIEEHKQQRLDEQLHGHLARELEIEVRTTATVPPSTLADLVRMGPSAHHLSPSEVERAAARAGDQVTVSVVVTRFRRC